MHQFHFFKNFRNEMFAEMLSDLKMCATWGLYFAMLCWNIDRNMNDAWKKICNLQFFGRLAMGLTVSKSLIYDTIQSNHGFF